MKGLPEICSRRECGAGLDLELVVPPDCRWFTGHFPDHPILPGVVQVGWAAWFAAQWTGRSEPPSLLERVKFRYPVKPGMRLALQLRRQPDADAIGFAYLLVTATPPINVSSGVLAFPRNSATPAPDRRTAIPSGQP